MPTTTTIDYMTNSTMNYYERDYEDLTRTMMYVKVSIKSFLFNIVIKYECFYEYLNIFLNYLFYWIIFEIPIN